MTREGFARLAFEAYHDAGHPAGGGWDAWSAMHPDGTERAKWLAVGALVEACVDGATAGAQETPAPAKEPVPVLRYALVEQMGWRATLGTVREIQFLGKPALEVTPLDGGPTRVIGGIGDGL